MPFFYTHYIYGLKCLELIPEEYKTIVNQNMDYYILGAQGPNIFYYHSPFLNKKYKDIADNLHIEPIYSFISKTKTRFISCKNRDTILSYSLGYLTHFMLDSYCNNYINSSSIILNISPTYINKEIEYYFLNKNSINNINGYLKKLNTSKSIIKTLSTLFDIDEGAIKQSIENMKQYNSLMYNSNKKIIILLSKILTILNKKELNNYLIYKDNKLKNIAQIIRINKYYEISALHYKKLIKNYLKYLIEDEQLDAYFFNSFIDKQKKIDVLNLQDEKEYIINSYMK